MHNRIIDGISIVIPALNEEKGLKATIENIITVFNCFPMGTLLHY